MPRIQPRIPAQLDREAYVEAVLSAIEQIPPGQAASYGDIAAYVGQGGPRQVGTVMSSYGGAVCWWRVVRADGRPVAGLEDEALHRLRSDDTPLLGDRVDWARARWRPEADPSADPGSEASD